MLRIHYLPKISQAVLSITLAGILFNDSSTLFVSPHDLPPPFPNSIAVLVHIAMSQEITQRVYQITGQLFTVDKEFSL